MIGDVVPVRAALVIPAEGVGYGSEDAACAVAETWLGAIASWLQSQLGAAPEIDFRCHRSRLTHREIATSGDGRTVLLDAQDQGLHEDALWGKVFPEAGFPEGRDRRQWAIVVGAGGWAGGRFDRAQNIGACAVGDWGLHYVLTGRPDAGCLAHYDANFCSPGSAANPTHPAWALGHEVLHSLGLTDEFGFDIHSRGKYIGLGDALTREQKAWLLQENATFLA